MDGMIRGGAQHFLDYREMAEIKDPESQLTKSLVDEIKQTLLEQIRVETPNVVDYDKAFRIQVRLLDDMNLVGKLEEIPILSLPLSIPTPDLEKIYTKDKPLRFRDRIKILMKGRLD